jgi:predicted ATPase
MRDGLNAWQGTGATLGRPNFSTLLADALGRADRLDEACEIIAQALQAVQNTEERVNEAELYRLQGEIMQKQGVTSTRVEKSLQNALEIARQQAAKSVELRVAVSLGRLWAEEGKPENARTLLNDLCNWFSEGLDSVDMLEARETLGGIA